MTKLENIKSISFILLSGFLVNFKVSVKYIKLSLEKYLPYPYR